MRLRLHKYNAQPTTIDGIRFASKKEAKRYQELKLLEKIDQISNLKRQVEFPIEINGRLICSYRADFTYFEHDLKNRSATLIVEDSKGYKTPEYKLKKKLLKACYGYDIRET